MFEIENTWIYGKNKQYKSRFNQPINQSIAVISGVTINNGVNYWTNDVLNDDEIFEDCLTISTRGEYSGTVTYHEGKFVLANNILTMPMPGWSKNAKLFIASIIDNIGYGGYSGYPRKETLKNDIIQLPLKKIPNQVRNDGHAELDSASISNIDFDFMESFIRELEEERIRELEEERIRELNAYLLATGLKDYKLTSDEENVLEAFKTVQWGEFEFKQIFNNIKQGRRLKKEDQKEGTIPFVMSGTTNTGVVGYISNPVASFPSNSITVDIFGNTFYRNYDFGAGDDTGVYWNDKENYSKDEMLFFTTAMGKSLFGKFDYGNKLRSSQSLDIKMQLPTKDGKPDYATMETFIKAVEKLVIKDVVLYADSRIGTTKKVVQKDVEYKTNEGAGLLKVAEK